jgi:hypothetical protein
MSNTLFGAYENTNHKNQQSEKGETEGRHDAWKSKRKDAKHQSPANADLAKPKTAQGDIS